MWEEICILLFCFLCGLFKYIKHKRLSKIVITDLKTLPAYLDDDEPIKETGLIELIHPGQTVAHHTSLVSLKERRAYLQHFIMKYHFYERKCRPKIYDVERMDSGGSYCVVCCKMIAEESSWFIWRDYIHSTCALYQIIPFIGQRNVLLTEFCQVEVIRKLILSLLFNACITSKINRLKT